MRVKDSARQATRVTYCPHYTLR